MGDCSQMIFKLFMQAVDWLPLSATVHFPNLCLLPAGLLFLSYILPANVIDERGHTV